MNASTANTPQHRLTGSKPSSGMIDLGSFVPPPTGESLHALSAALVLIRASGVPQAQLTDLRQRWHSAHLVHMPIDGLLLSGTLDLAAALRQQGIAAESCPVQLTPEWNLEALEQDARQWLVEKVSAGCGVLVNLEIHAAPDLHHQYLAVAQQPNSGHTVIVVALPRDDGGQLQAVGILDPALPQPFVHLPLDQFMLAWAFRGFEAVATTSALPVPLTGQRRGLS